MSDLSSIGYEKLDYSYVNQKSTDLLKSWDSDGSGSLSKDEFKLSLDKFTESDTDGDGAISVDELNNTYYARELAKISDYAFKEQDKDGDSLISSDEFAFSAIDFASVDKNSDGSVDKDELFASSPALKAYQDLLSSLGISGSKTSTQVQAAGSLNITV